jgi:L-ascorbate metabolism protein UlaG (beta-lactamase superfamily)
MPDNALTITWLGHATMHLTTPAGTSIVIDPWMTGNPAYPKHAPDLEKVDLMLCTHGHGDHIGDAVALSKKYSPQTVGVVELCIFLAEQGAVHTHGMNIGGSHKIADVTIHMTTAIHSSGIEHNGEMIYGGIACGFVLEIENAPTVYHAGDTALFSDMRLIGEYLRPDIAMLPIGDFYTMGPRQASIAAKFLGAKKVLPMHYGTFPVLTGTREAFSQELEGSGIEMLRLDPGDSYRA